MSDHKYVALKNQKPLERNTPDWYRHKAGLCWARGEFKKARQWEIMAVKMGVIK